MNDQRVVAPTAIRGAGETITVNFRPLGPPYEIRAIGADLTRFRASEVAQRFVGWTDLFGFGFDARRRGRVEVPAFAGATGLSSARPAPSGDDGETR